MGASCPLKEIQRTMISAEVILGGRMTILGLPIAHMVHLGPQTAAD